MVDGNFLSEIQELECEGLNEISNEDINEVNADKHKVKNEIGGKAIDK